MAVGMTEKGHGTLHCGVNLSLMTKVNVWDLEEDYRKSHSNLFKEYSHYFH